MKRFDGGGGGGSVGSENGRGNDNNNNNMVPFYKLFSFADSMDVALMSVGTVGALLNGLSMPLSIIIFGQLINVFGTSVGGNVVHEVSKVVLKYVYLAAGSGVAALLQVSCWMVTGERQATRIRALYLKTILRQDIAFFDKETTTGEVIGRMSGDTILIQDALGEKVTYAEAGNVVEQTVGSIRTVMSFTGEKQAITKYKKSLKTAYRFTVHEGIASGLGIGIFLFVLFFNSGLAIWHGSMLIISKGYNGGDVINVMLAIMTGGMSLGQTSPCLKAFAAGQAAAYKMLETIKRKPEIDAYDTSGIVLEDIKGDIELRNVSFSYPARLDILIFDDFSLHVPSGTTAALVGESGSGKSTVISLVGRFYDPQAGEILIDGINLKKLRLGWIREKIGLVSQEPILFTTTIKENIAYGKANATLQEIKRATELANAAKFIDNMPNGLDTVVGEHGTRLSGGQKQLIAITRAILKNPTILLLDEATSALDAESERIVQDALLRIMLDRTTIVVAHRLSTVRIADTIAVLHQGKFVEQGCHSELIKDPDGAYSQLIRLQETNRQAEDTLSTSSEKLVSSLDVAKPGSQRFSLRRSLSRGSSGGRSSRHSFTTTFGLPEITAFTEGVPTRDGEDDNCKVHKQVSITRLACLNKPELPILLLGSIVAAVNGVIFPVFGILISTAIKIFYEPPRELQKDARFWALMCIVLGLICLVVLPLQHYLFAVAGGKLIQRICSLSFERVVHQEIGWFDEPTNSSGAISARLSVNASSVRSLVGDALALIVQNITTVTAGIVIAMVANWRLALIILVLIPLVGLQGYAQMKFLEGFSADAKVMYEEASQVANDAVSSIRTVASFCAEQRVMDIYNKKCEAPMKHGVQRGIISGMGFGFSIFVLYCTYALCFYIGSRFVEDGKATFAQVFRVFFALTMAAVGVSQTSSLGPDANKAKDSTASIFAILDRKSKIDSSNEEGITLETVNGEIEFQHVSFKYPTRPHVQILSNLCLNIPSGKTFALVGESGSGKSTVIALLERFYDPDSGQIFLDGVEIHQIKLNWLRQQIGLVNQEPILFNDAIRANIAYGKQGEVSEEEIIAAAEAANAHRFISGLPQGYDTPIGERGVQLSGGQKQRIAIARAILKDPRILLLDEATSALDAESEHMVQEALDRVMVNRSTVVVAHRLSTIKGADVIAVVKNGVIAEKGRHEVLMNLKGGAYASLVALQMSSTA